MKRKTHWRVIHSYKELEEEQVGQEFSEEKNFTWSKTEGEELAEKVQ